MQHLTIRRQAGISLIEVLLAMAISVVMLAGLAYLLFDSQQALRAKNAAEQMQAFQRVAAQYFSSHRSGMLKAMGGDPDNPDDLESAALYCQVDVPRGEEFGTPAFNLGKHTCTIDASLLRAKRLLSDGQVSETPHGEKLVAVFRRIYDDEGLATGNVDMLVLTVLGPDVAYAANRKRYAESLEVAANLGATGGVLADGDRGNCKASRGSATYEVCGNGWKTSLDEFLDADQLSRFSALLSD